MTEYLKHMKTHGDNIGLAGSLVFYRNLVSQVFTCLDEEYNPIIVVIQGKIKMS